MSGIRCDALLIAAPGSGHGKTSIVAGLARYHARNGKRVRAFKVGPDFIDPTILAQASGNPCRQLDLWMIGKSECQRLLYEGARGSDIVLVEGVIGLYDGKPSTADLAEAFNLPVGLVINARGMAETVHAIAHGLATFNQDLECRGYVVNGVRSGRHEAMIASASAAAGAYLGSIFEAPESAIPSRHLGLHQAEELADLQLVLDRLADAVSNTGLVSAHKPVVFAQPDSAICISACRSEPLVGRTPPLAGAAIAIARDPAFSFIYEENLEMLRRSGAELTFFSPLSDWQLPSCSAVYLPGGYPELHAERLSKNAGMKQALAEHVSRGGKIYAECGGMLYLLDSLSLVNGDTFPMCGLLPGRARMQERMAALGYQAFQVDDESVPAHTFHYSRLNLELVPEIVARRRSDGEPGEGIFRRDGITASYLHVYFESCPGFVARVLGCTAHDREKLSASRG